MVLKMTAAIAAIVAVCIWLNMLASPAWSQVQISVDASKLPASCEVLGAKVTLQPVGWKGKRAWFKLNLDSHSMPIEGDDNRIFFNGKEFNPRLYHAISTNYRGLGEPYLVETSMDIQPPSGVQRFDFLLGFHIKAKSKSVRFRFANLYPNRLPAKKRIGSATVTLRSIGLAKLTDNSWQMSRPPFNCVPKDRQFAVLQADISVPGIYEYKAKVTGTATSEKYSAEGSEQSYDIFEANPTMRAEGRSVLTAAAYKSDVVSDAPYAFFREAKMRTIPERVIGVVSQKLAYKMVTGRAMNVANAVKLSAHMLVWLAFPTDGAIPKRMNFEMSVQLPPDAGEKAVVVFKNAPIR